MLDNYTIFIKSIMDLVAAGKKISEMLEIGDIVLMYGELGAGKTTLAKYIIAHLLIQYKRTSACNNVAIDDIIDEIVCSVTSPTFNIVNVYGNPPLVYHYDLYRISNSDELRELDIEYGMENGITIIEWPEVARTIISFERALVIKLSVINDDCRKVSIYTQHE